MKIRNALTCFFLLAMPLSAATSINPQEAIKLLGLNQLGGGGDQPSDRKLGIYSMVQSTDFTPEFIQWHESQNSYNIMDLSNVPLKLTREISPGAPKYMLIKRFVKLGMGSSEFFRFPPVGADLFIIDFNLKDAMLGLPRNGWDSIIGISNTDAPASITLRHSISSTDSDILVSLLKQIIEKTPNKAP